MRLSFTGLGYLHHGKWRRFVLLIALSVVAATSNAAVDSKVKLQQTLQQAEDLQLAQHESWLALLHYKRETILRRFISQVDDDNFFLDEAGKSDAAAELAASIRAFFRGSEAGHAQCLFPARWWWLKKQLALPDDMDVSCPRLDAFMQRVAHDRVYLVFPSMYLNNPGSMFGHTFLRFDDNDGSILLSQTLNYAARVDQSDDMVSYISKGLFGGYNGFFRARPYFETVQEYSNIENRDIWEYQLDFSVEEIEQLVRHIWEVKGIDFDYFFFRENCSYRLLALLDVVRPGMQLTTGDNFPVYAIPVDTVRALADADLILGKTFRASLATQIDDFFLLADEKSAEIALAIQSDEMAADKVSIQDALDDVVTGKDKLRVLKQSYDMLQFEGLSSSPKASVLLQLTKEYSQTYTDTEFEKTVRHDVSPETGHESLKLTAAYGEQNSLAYIDLRFRTAFHDLLDAPQGYVSGAAINVFDGRVKWFLDDEESGHVSDHLRLESLSVFNVTALSPVSQWQTPVSWLFDFRFDRTQLSETESLRNFISRGGAGFTLKHQFVKSFVLLMGEWNLASDYDKGHSVLLGLQVGALLNMNANQLKVSYQLDEAVSGFELDRSITELQWQYNLQINHALRAEYKLTEYDFFDDEDWSLGYSYYF